jgi:hypothetical protein
MYHPAAALHQPALRGALLSDFAHLKTFLNKDRQSETPTPPPSVPTKMEDEPEAEQLSLF